MPTDIGKNGLDLIISCEVTSPEYYSVHYQNPSWPGGDSGVTIGIGDDLGYKTAQELREDWGNELSQTALDSLAECCGIKGSAAQSKAAALAFLRIPYDSAQTVFHAYTMPRYVALTQKTFPNCNALPQDCFDALVSLVYNRGVGMTDAPGDTKQSRLEMRQIFTAMSREDFVAIPTYLRSMKRLWTNGLVERREREAVLFQQGLDAALPNAMQSSPSPTVDETAGDQPET